MLEILKSGLYTTIQDQGRYKYRAYGVPTSGAMDLYAFSKANYLLGNSDLDAAIEMFFGGVEVRAHSNVWISMTGADVRPQVDGNPVEMWKPFQLLEGQRLKCFPPKNGVITYLGIFGGVDSTDYLGSKSVYEKAGFGRRLKVGDMVRMTKSIQLPTFKPLESREIPTYTSNIAVRVIPGPHEHLFTEQSIHEFYHKTFTIKKGDRMGSLIDGLTPIKLKNDTDILSEAVTSGTIQVPHNGNPTVLLADAQTTGGYPIIASIHTEDLWRYVQLPPGGKVRFSKWIVK